MDEQKQSYSNWEDHQVPQVSFNHYKFRDAVDVYNGIRKFLIAIEETWETNHWACRVFTFLLALTELNCCTVQNKLYRQPAVSQQEFRKKLAKATIHNRHLSQGEERSHRKSARLNLPEHWSISVSKKIVQKNCVLQYSIYWACLLSL